MSFELSAENPVYIKLKHFNHLKSPKLCVLLDTRDETMDGNGVDLSAKSGQKCGQKSVNECNSCHVLKRLVCIKDIAINRLSEDREDIKLRLTEINNKNIELKQRLKRFECEEREKSCDNGFDGIDAIESDPRYRQLVAINSHLRRHLNTLRQVFNDLHNSSDSNENETTIDSTANTTSTSANTTVHQTTQTETRTESQSTSTEDNVTNDNKLTDDSIDDKQRVGESLPQKSSFEKWYEK